MAKKIERKLSPRTKERLRAQKEKREAEEPPDWMLNVIKDPRTGGSYWPTYVPPNSLDHLGSLLAQREALDYALREIQDEETKSKIEMILEKVIKAQYYEEEVFGSDQYKHGSIGYIQATKRAAESTHKKMMDDYDEGHNYGQISMRKIISDWIEGIESIIRIKKERKDASDTSTAIEDAVTRIAKLKAKEIRNSDMIGQIIFAAGLFRGIRCVYKDELRYKPQLTKDGLEIEAIPLDERSKFERMKTPKCKHFEPGTDQMPTCLYHPRMRYCGKATERVERILAARK